jgi:hypothetical protein
MPLTPDAKKLLAETLRGTAQDPQKGIRARLLSLEKKRTARNTFAHPPRIG